ncbi:serine/threonine protein kinase [Streptomyces sp. V4I2]|nr:protein kinase [Streptomyces sp. V4I2]MDQ1051176.1 serine/threonine protein kinase [Streptomyces sp. V4I2]
MRPLTSDDPEEIGGHRLLARLGAGGMGVVYLARTAGGALVALKTIRAEHAADPVFRTRFRREVTAVRGLTGRWLVPVVAADTEGREPWLATEFVPGPSLAEAVDAFGALPVAAVRTLGSRLADALTAVHDAGVVHRDVKPGNVLLALDGPPPDRLRHRPRRGRHRAHRTRRRRRHARLPRAGTGTGPRR